ncbi:MAG: hypothetical protein ACQEQE_00390 [Bacillota bacterium]
MQYKTKIIDLFSNKSKSDFTNKFIIKEQEELQLSSEYTDKSNFYDIKKINRKNNLYSIEL